MLACAVPERFRCRDVLQKKIERVLFKEGMIKTKCKQLRNHARARVFHLTCGECTAMVIGLTVLSLGSKLF